MKWFAEECRLPEKKALFDTHGLTFQSQLLRSPSIWTIDPENIKAIRQTDYQSFGFAPIRYDALEPLMGKSMFTCDGEIWAHARSMITPIFKRAQVVDLGGFMRYVERFVAKVPKDDESIDLSPLIFDLFLDTSFEQLFGQLDGSRNEELLGMDSRTFLKVFRKVQKGAGRRLMLGRLRWIFPDQEFNGACRSLNATIDRQIDACRKRQKEATKLNTESNDRPKKHVVLDELVLAGADQATIRGILLSAFTAAHESGAILTENVFFLVTKQSPDVWRRIREEALTITKDDFTIEKFRHLTFIRAVIDETNRLYPVIGSNSRAALRDTILPRGGGKDGRSPIFVAKNTPVLTFPYVLHRSVESFGADAEVFRPERWLAEDAHRTSDLGNGDEGRQKQISNSVRHGERYIPFGLGPRRCPAQERAILETTAVVVRLAQRFVSIESRDGREWQEKAGLVARNRNGCKVVLSEE